MNEDIKLKMCLSVKSDSMYLPRKILKTHPALQRLLPYQMLSPNTTCKWHWVLNLVHGYDIIKNICYFIYLKDEPKIYFFQTKYWILKILFMQEAQNKENFTHFAQTSIISSLSSTLIWFGALTVSSNFGKTKLSKTTQKIRNEDYDNFTEYFWDKHLP